MIRLYTAAYGNSGMNARQVLEEMVCDAMGKMNAFATEETSTVAGEVGQFLRDLRKTALETRTEGQKNNAQEGVKFSREIFDNAARQFDNEISQWDNDGRDGDRQFILGTTGEILQGLGAVENDIYMNGDKINTILEEHPEMTLSEIKQIPQILNDPTLILKSRNVGRRGSQNTRMVLFGTAKAQNNLPIMVIFDVRPTEGHFVVTDMQKVTSAYTKTTDAVGFVKNSFVMYADKKRATPLLRTIGFHTPIELRQGGYVGSIAYNKQNVNLYGEEFSNVFREGTTKYSRELDSEYMELAKDPEGNSTELRKMVDQAAEQQGYKTLFYHGSKKGGGFTEFRDWQYFTPKKEYAERYAQRGNPDSLYSVFVKMENPFDTRNAKARRIFQKARGELGLSEIQGTGLPDWTDGYDLADYIDENGLNYDAIVLDEGGDLVNGKPVSRGLSYVVRKSNQVKSADAVVYDDNGKVIPLSERFNSDKRDIRYSRELTTDGRIVAVVDEDILSNLDLSNWNQETKEAAQKAAAAALLKFQDGIAVEGITRKVNRISRKEFTRSEYTNELFWWNSTAFLDKMRAANNLDDVVIATTDWARDGKLKHPRTDNFVDFDHGTTLIASGDAKYEAEVVVGITDKGDAVFYDIVNMKQGDFSIKKEESSPTATTNKSPGSIFEDSSKKNVAQQSENVKQKYSRELELDSEGNALTQEQADFFADSEVRNDDGELIPVYHKTTESFTVFKRGKLGEGTLGNATDASLAATSLIGHWFSDSENTPFMGDAMKTYLNIKKPYYTSLDEMAADMGDLSGDLEMMQDHFDRGQYNMVREAARSYVRWMKWKGYDGLIVNDTETGGTSYVILNSNQAKLTDNGKPTSKRDIRYSRELETVEALKRQNEILQKQRDYWKEQTRTTDEKTRGADKGEVRSLAGQLIRQYSSKTEVEEILPEMQWLADSIWRNDPKISYTDLQDSAQNIARMVLDGSEVNLNAENWETGQELKRFLRGRYINVDESLKENIGDFKNFKRSNRSLHFRENGTGTGVASLWLELQNDFGKGLFPDSISNPGDQIRHIADTLASLTESDIQNPYAADMELTVEQMAYDVMARAAGLNRQKATKTDNTADSPLLYSVRMLTWAEVSWSMLPSS